jgi:hypothetical protein
MRVIAVVAAAGAFLALAVPRPPARAQVIRAGYSFDGGTQRERATVRSALAASAFDWWVVGREVTIHIIRSGSCSAVPGQIWLDSRMLAHGRDAWGVVQHEYGHEVDYFLLNAESRARLETLLGGKTWWLDGRFRHNQYGAEALRLDALLRLLAVAAQHALTGRAGRGDGDGTGALPSGPQPHPARQRPVTRSGPALGLRLTRRSVSRRACPTRQAGHGQPWNRTFPVARRSAKC